MKRLIILAEALEGLGEINSAELVRILSKPALICNANWVDDYFKNDPELKEKARLYSSTHGKSLQVYFNELGEYTEEAGKEKVKKDLATIKDEQKEELQPGELSWPFPPPEVLKDKGVFIENALAWAMGEGSGLYTNMYGSTSNLREQGKKGEVQAARAYLRHLMKDIAPQLASTLQNKWREASEKNDTDAQNTLRTWWKTLSQVWVLLQKMIKSINEYEKA